MLLAAFVVFVSLRLREGRLGRAWLAIREDELAASMMGVPLMRTKLAAYAVGAVAGGLGGVAFAAHTAASSRTGSTSAISITLLAMVVLGGMGNVWGVMIGALVLAWVNAQRAQADRVTINSAFGTDIDFPSYNYLLFGADPRPDDAVPTRRLDTRGAGPSCCCASRAAPSSRPSAPTSRA